MEAVRRQVCCYHLNLVLHFHDLQHVRNNDDWTVQCNLGFSELDTSLSGIN